MLLWCPQCGARHIDEREFATKPHHTHACQKCGMCWRPAVVPTVGVLFLPGFKNEDDDERFERVMRETNETIKAAESLMERVNGDR